MALRLKINVVEKCRISPPQITPPIALPLTFFDIPWLLFSPSKSIFFYKFLNSTTTHFTNKILPFLKHSLSLTLHHFSPFSGNISTPSPPLKPQIIYTQGDFVLLTIVECDGETFNQLCSNHPRDVSKLLSLVPGIESSLMKDVACFPSLAVQITSFGDIGMSIGLTFQHVVADERTFNNFLKSWASTCKYLLEGKLLVNIFDSPTFYDRNVIIDPKGNLQTTLLSQWRNVMKSQKYQTFDILDMVQATFVLSLDDMEKIKKLIMAQCRKVNQPRPSILSSYVLACAYVWVCLMKSQGITSKNATKTPVYLRFIAGGITRLDFPIPATYFGNCVAFGRAEAMQNDIISENGVFFAAKSIAETIKDLNEDVLRDAKSWISEWDEVLGSYNGSVSVVGSPKVNIYNMDFGWGKPNKIEKISVDRGTAICLSESRDTKGRIEVGIVLSKANMCTFTSLFDDVLKLQN